MDDSLAEIEFELSRQNACQANTNAVSFLRDALRLVISGVEIANGRLGPFLHLDGWANSICSDMKRYDNALERVAKRHFRRQAMSPIMELGFLMVGSLVMWHFKTSLFGPAVVPPAPPAPPASATSTGPPEAQTSATSSTARRRELHGPFRRS